MFKAFGAMILYVFVGSSMLEVSFGSLAALIIGVIMFGSKYKVSKNG